MYNLRYHIASLVAVFLALSLGLLLGGITVQSGVLTRQRAALVTSLRTDYTKLKTQNQTLNADLQLERELATALVDDAVAGRLDGATVLVLTNAGQVEGLSATEAAIRDAGGEAVTVALTQPSLGLDESQIASSVAQATGTEPGSAADALQQASAALAKEWTDGVAGPVTKALNEAGVLDSAEAPAERIAGVVDLAAFDGKADPGALALAVEFQRLGTPSLGAQRKDSKSNLAQEADAAGISALDTLGTEAGRYTLVMLLTGADPGYYGVGQGTIASFPPPSQME